MKKVLILVACSLALCGCGGTSPDINPPSAGSGTLKIALTPKDDLATISAGAPATKADAAVGDFGVVIKNATTGENYASYASYSDVPSELSIPAGTYSIEARNGAMKSAAFDAPSYYGSSPLTMAVGESQSINVTCQIINIKVTVAFKPNILNTLKDVTATVKSEYEVGKLGALTYSADEKRAGWFAPPAAKTMSVNVSGIHKQTEEVISQNLTLSNVSGRQWRQVNVDIRTSGSAGIEIDIDDEILIMPEDDVYIPDGEDVIDNNGDNGNWEEGEDPDPEGPAGKLPTIIGSSFEGSPFDIDEPVTVTLNGENELDVMFKSTHTGGIQNLFLTIESEALKDILVSLLGITGEIDLANPPAVGTAMWVEMFQDPMIGILDPSVPIKGKKEHKFAVGPLMGLLGGLPGALDSPHQFHIRVVDGNGTTSKTLTINLEN